MAKDFSTMEDSNRSSNPSIHEVSDPARRVLLRGASALAAAPLLAPLFGCATAGGGARIGFKAIPAGLGDQLVVAEGYAATVLAPWGEPVGIAGNMPAWKDDGSNTAADQAVQMGMHHDGIEYFPLAGSSTRGLLAMNHEALTDHFLHANGSSARPRPAGESDKELPAHGVSIIEVSKGSTGAFGYVQASSYNRRVTPLTPAELSGPVRGSALRVTVRWPCTGSDKCHWMFSLLVQM